MMLFYFPYLAFDGVLELCAASLSAWELSNSEPINLIWEEKA